MIERDRPWPTSGFELARAVLRAVVIVGAWWAVATGALRVLA